jgi:hypothetical protein
MITLQIVKVHPGGTIGGSPARSAVVNAPPNVETRKMLLSVSPSRHPLRRSARCRPSPRDLRRCPWAWHGSVRSGTWYGPALESGCLRRPRHGQPRGQPDGCTTPGRHSGHTRARSHGHNRSHRAEAPISPTILSRQADYSQAGRALSHAASQSKRSHVIASGFRRTRHELRQAWTYRTSCLPRHGTGQRKLRNLLLPTIAKSGSCFRSRASLRSAGGACPPFFAAARAAPLALV